MYIELLDQDLTITSHEEALVLHDNGHVWNVLSISDRVVMHRPEFPNARRTVHLFFDDVEADHPAEGHFAARPEDIQAALSFARNIENEPLLIHCYAGISRSTAIAWLIAFDRLKEERADAVRRGFEIVKTLRPMLRPNRHVLNVGLDILIAHKQRQEVRELFLECLAELDSF